MQYTILTLWILYGVQNFAKVGTANAAARQNPPNITSSRRYDHLIEAHGVYHIFIQEDSTQFSSLNQGRKILMVFDTWRRQNGHLETAEEHVLHSTCPQGINETSTSLFKHTRHDHAAFAVSASLVAMSDFSCIGNAK